MIELGMSVKDRVTGFKGIVTARVEYLNGCVQYLVKPKVNKEGKFMDSEWIDNQQLQVTGRGISVKPRKVGGYMGKDTPHK